MAAYPLRGGEGPASPHQRRAAMLEEVREGLLRTPRSLPSKYFYDARGSQLFDQITKLPAYYLTSAERTILEAHAAELADAARTLVELGAGSPEKGRLLLVAILAAGGSGGADGPVTYVPVDVSEASLARTRETLARDMPDVRVIPLAADLAAPLPLPDGLPEPRLFAFFGSTIGNFDAGEAAALLRRVRQRMGPADRLLLGTDLRKDRATLEAAYNDPAGITAEFNRNILRVINAELGADFKPDQFEHEAVYREDAHRIEMRLRSTRRQAVRIPGLPPIVLGEGEAIRTEVSAKFDRPSVEAMANAAGLRLTGWFTDPRQRFALSVLDGRS